ncbi:aminoglycoside 2'-N-acetyltransferase [Wenjunlia vitaminophila]|uniref:Aminoglycoside 2'-N-acetyltransferase n=1 Tax=Wenjunlia vitaminophila TaxID=76728 RepID=A0A0T6LVL1_WENVI|nr:GNAT family N-acetyltransferase [Wenjunlia vitaminophila]KRV50040.1 aminoglycoside 2'-N-acetyltransferase [Wenjunlia vitaminophila]
MAELWTGHTAELDAAELAVVRTLLDEVFEGDFSDADWDHTLGGIHTLVRHDGEVIGHAAVVQRRLLHQGRVLRTGYVEGVAVHADHRGRGHAGRMLEQLERVIRGGYQVGALSASDDGAGMYAGRGWQRWRGTTSALTPTGTVRTSEDDDSVFVLPLGVPLELTGELTCDWREGDLW